MTRVRVVVGVLGGLAAALAFLVGAVSLFRIAGDYLGFPPGLEWTFTGAVDVAGIAGGVMWTAFTGPVRAIGKPMNIVCTIVSGVGVGLDHATHAGRALRVPDANVALPIPAEAWPIVAFVAGLFMPALATWILHALAVMADSREAGQDGDTDLGDRLGDQQSHRQETHVVIASSQPGDPQLSRQFASSDRQFGTATSPDSLAPRARQVASSGAAASPGSPACERPGSAVSAPARRVAPTTPRTFPGPRPPWMTDALLADVVVSKRAKKRYGRDQIVRDYGERHGIEDYQARRVLEFIRKHDLVRVSA